ncbi:MAG: Fic family protein [Prevotellaceae bacterium]|jgi:Fic family protein|nr:Fic family protein [Prevotellaceae bacterium]
MNLSSILQKEKNRSEKGGLYRQTQIKFAYNSNHIEGSRLSEEQTRYIFETNTLYVENGGTANVNDIIETVNHFSCFDYLLEIAGEKLTGNHIKQFHALLKNATGDAKKTWFRVGEYKSRPNVVGELSTTAPENVSAEMDELLASYHKHLVPTFEDIVDFHCRFERIHPFQDGNGRVGRLIIFKECLAHDIMPFIIEEAHKFFYYRGLKEYPAVKGYLMDTCRAAQDNYGKMVQYFYPDLGFYEQK